MNEISIKQFLDILNNLQILSKSEDEVNRKNMNEYLDTLSKDESYQTIIECIKCSKKYYENSTRLFGDPEDSLYLIEFFTRIKKEHINKHRKEVIKKLLNE